jgi:hypothetical protein
MAQRSERRSGSEWSSLVRQWGSSGKSAAEFAAERGVSALRLQWWGSELRRRLAKDARSLGQLARRHSAFAELRVVSSKPSASAGAVEVHARSGLVVRVHGTVDPALLVSVLRAVAQC